MQDVLMGRQSMTGHESFQPREGIAVQDQSRKIKVVGLTQSHGDAQLYPGSAQHRSFWETFKATIRLLPALGPAPSCKWHRTEASSRPNKADGVGWKTRCGHWGGVSELQGKAPGVEGLTHSGQVRETAGLKTQPQQGGVAQELTD